MIGLAVNKPKYSTLTAVNLFFFGLLTANPIIFGLLTANPILFWFAG
jgi:hypothetical protein